MSPRQASANPMTTFGPADHGLPEVVLIGRHLLRRASEGLPDHTHPGLLEVCYLAKGERVFHVAGKDYALKGHDFFWTLGDETHGSGRHSDGKGLQYFVQVRLPPRGRGFLGLSARAAGPFVRALRALPVRHFPGRPQAGRLFDEIFQLCSRPSGPMNRLNIASRMVQWLCLVVECARDGQEARPSSDIRRALDLAARSPEVRLSIDELAAAARLSVSRFKAKFREQVGIPPGEFQMRCRLQAAWRLLTDRANSVTAVAHALGFSSSQYFATVFRRYTNARPGDVRHRTLPAPQLLPPATLLGERQTPGPLLPCGPRG